MDLGRFTRQLHYLVRGFPIFSFGNWDDGTEGGGDLEGRSRL